MSDRFIIDCYGILDTWKGNGDCKDKLSWVELCDILNELDDLSDENLDEYELITNLQYDIKSLKSDNELLRSEIELIKNKCEELI